MIRIYKLALGNGKQINDIYYIRRDAFDNAIQHVIYFRESVAILSAIVEDVSDVPVGELDWNLVRVIWA